MKYCMQLLVVLSLLMIHFPKAKPQNNGPATATAVEGSPQPDTSGTPAPAGTAETPAPSDTPAAEGSTQPGTSATPASGSTVMAANVDQGTDNNAPGTTPAAEGSAQPDTSGTPNPSDMPAEKGPTQPETSGTAGSGTTVMTPAPPTTTTQEPPVGRDVAEYLNRKIKQMLRENPEKDPTELKLAAIFNEKRAELEAALIREPPQEDDDIRAEQAFENFRNFMQQYNAIASRLKSSIDDLATIEQDPKHPIEVRYEALMLLLNLKDSSTIKDAEKVLKLNEDFRQRLNGDSVLQAPGTQLPVAPPLSDEFKLYFEEILNILRKHIKADGPEMQDLLQTLLNNPEQLKELAAALNNLSDEDFESEDYLLDLFSIF